MVEVLTSNTKVRGSIPGPGVFFAKIYNQLKLKTTLNPIQKQIFDYRKQL